MVYWNSKEECLSRDEIQKLQEERLLAQVRNVWENVPVYRERMIAAGVTPDDIKSLNDLPKLPFTSKQDLRDHYPFGLFAVPMSDIVRLHASSGTTGKQVVVGYTKKDLNMWAECCARALTAAGADKNDLVHVSYGYGLFTGGLGLHNGVEQIGATVIPVSTGNTERQKDIILDFGETVICSTPSYALYLAESLADQGVQPEDTNLRIGIFGAEPWTEEMRQEIQRKLGLKAYDIYGLTEVIGPGVAFECCEQNGMHINEDHFIPEIIDPDTCEVLPEGETGELVFSCVTKEAFPLLRYRTRDITSLSRERCACGRTLIKMNKPRGRSDDMLIIRGVNVFPSQVEAVLLNCGKTNPYYQLIVDRVNNTDTLDIIVEMSDSDFTDSIKGLEAEINRLRTAIESTLGIAVKVKLVEPRSLPRATGKAVRVIDKRKLVD